MVLTIQTPIRTTTQTLSFLNMGTILLIDKDHHVLLNVSQLLKQNGYCVVTADNTFYALKQVTENKNITLIISEITIPNFSVYGFGEFVKEYFGNLIPFILISELEKKEIKKHAYSLETDFYMEKPIDPIKLCLYVKYIDTISKRLHC